MGWTALSVGEKLTAAKFNERLATWGTIKGNNVPASIVDSYNVDSIDDNATGDYTINTATAFTDAGFAITTAIQDDSTGAIASASSVDASSFDIDVRRSTDQSKFDTNRLFFIAAGDRT